MLNAPRALIVFVLTSLLVPVVALGTVLGSFLFLPLPATLPEPRPNIESRITHVYDVDGNQIAVLHRFDTSIPVRRADIPRVLKQAVVAAEDRRFYSHGGVDFWSALRALWADIQGGGYVEGGSTITQQYVKDAYTGRERTLLRKLREAVLASQLNRKVSKDEVLYRYLSGVYLGSGTYGVGAAAESYFRKPVNQLTLSEAALLAGLIRTPSELDPRKNPSGAEDKRLLVLDQMLSQHRISQQDYDDAAAQGIYVLSEGKPAPSRPATLIQPPQDQQAQHPFYVDYVRQYLIAKYGVDKVYRSGLKVQTALDPRLQAQAEKAVADALDGTQDPVSMSLVSVEPATGYVRALVGGRDYQKSQVNLALGYCKGVPKPDKDALAICLDSGGLGRQTGSAFKPFTLATAFEKGIPPTKVYRAPSVFHICNDPNPMSGCNVHNVEGEGGGAMPLRQALWHSVNTVFAGVMYDPAMGDKPETRIKATADVAHRIGMTMINPEGKRYSDGVAYTPANLTLGVYEESPLDMASSFGVFAARGMKAPVTPVLKVTDANGKVLEDNTKPQPRRVLAEEVADNVTDVMRGVIASGTGRAADIGRPAAGKTGTTDDYTDAWFVGFTPALSTAVWLGHSTDKASLSGTKGIERVYGGTIPAQTWHNFMGEALKDVPVTDFNEPAPIRPPPPPPGPPSTALAAPPPRPPDTFPTIPPEYYVPFPTDVPYTYVPDTSYLTTTTSSTTSTTRPRGLLFPVAPP